MRLQSSHDEAAWETFVARYGPRIFGWCQSRGLQVADAEDVTQNVLVQMTKSLAKFQYDESKSFRGWLRRVTENAIVDCFRERRASNDRRMTDAYESLRHLEARANLVSRLNDVFDIELLEHARERVRQRITDNRWLAWELTAIHDEPAATVKEKLSMPITSVYTARNQVQEMIRKEVRRLETAGL